MKALRFCGNCRSIRPSSLEHWFGWHYGRTVTQRATDMGEMLAGAEYGGSPSLQYDQADPEHARPSPADDTKFLKIDDKLPSATRGKALS